MRPGFAALLSLSFAWATPALAQADGLAVPERTPLRGVGVYERPPLPPAAPADTTEIMQVVERPPSLIGGLEGLQERMIYPESMRRAGIEGTVFKEARYINLSLHYLEQVIIALQEKQKHVT